MALALFLTLGFAVAAPGLAAQNRYSSNAELAGSWFFGNTRQSALTSRVGATRADSVAEVDLGLRFTYGEAANDDGTFVNKRSWIASVGIDLNPFNTVTPFVFGSYEESLEQRIAGRLQGGIGGKWAILRVDSPAGAPAVTRRLDVSLAALVERTEPRPIDGAAIERTRVLRGSARLRHAREVGSERVTFNTVAWYRPNLKTLGDYTAEFDTALGIELVGSLSLSIRLVDRYDSRAVSRGASSNHDGQLSVGLATTF